MRFWILSIVSLLLTFHATAEDEPLPVLEVEPATQEVLRGDILLLRVTLRNQTDLPMVATSPLRSSLLWDEDTDNIGSAPNDLGPSPWSGSFVKAWTLQPKEERSTFLLATRQLGSERDSWPAFEEVGKRTCRVIIRNFGRKKERLESDVFSINVVEERTPANRFPLPWAFASPERKHLEQIERLKASPERPLWEREVRRSSRAGLLTVACSPWQDAEDAEAFEQIIETCNKLDPVTRDYSLGVLAQYYYYPYTGRRPKLVAKMIELMKVPSHGALALAEILRTEHKIEINLKNR